MCMCKCVCICVFTISYTIFQSLQCRRRVPLLLRELTLLFILIYSLKHMKTTFALLEEKKVHLTNSGTLLSDFLFFFHIYLNCIRFSCTPPPLLDFTNFSFTNLSMPSPYYFPFPFFTLFLSPSF